MSEQLHERVDELKMEQHLVKHRLSTLEAERLPRLEAKMDDLVDRVDIGLREVRDAINGQRHLQKGVVLAVAAVVGAIQLIPYLKGLLT